MPNNRRRAYVAESSLGTQVNNAMENFKTEVAAEIGLANYNNMDKGWLASRQNGYVGGNMTKKMVAYAEEVINQQGAEVVRTTQVVLEVSPEVRQLNEMASNNMQGFQQALYGLQQGQGQQQFGTQLDQQGGGLH